MTISPTRRTIHHHDGFGMNESRYSSSRFPPCRLSRGLGTIAPNSSQCRQLLPPNGSSHHLVSHDADDISKPLALIQYPSRVGDQPLQYIFDLKPLQHSGYKGNASLCVPLKADEKDDGGAIPTKVTPGHDLNDAPPLMEQHSMTSNAAMSDYAPPKL